MGLHTDLDLPSEIAQPYHSTDMLTVTKPYLCAQSFQSVFSPTSFLFSQKYSQTAKGCQMSVCGS